MKLLGIAGSSQTASKTMLAVERAVNFAREYQSDVDAEAINLGNYAVDFYDGRQLDEYHHDTQLVIDKVLNADAYIIGSPMYRGSYSGRLKNLFDLLPNDAMRGKPVGLIATGGSDHHYLALEHELKPLMGFFLGFVLPGVVYANNNHYSDSGICNAQLIERLNQLGKAVVNFYKMLPLDTSAIIGASGPEIKRVSLREIQSQCDN